MKGKCHGGSVESGGNRPQKLTFLKFHREA